MQRYGRALTRSSGQEPCSLSDFLGFAGMKLMRCDEVNAAKGLHLQGMLLLAKHMLIGAMCDGLGWVGALRHCRVVAAAWPGPGSALVL